jgi:hypothetical protein
MDEDHATTTSPPPLQLGISHASLCKTAAHCRKSTNFSSGLRTKVFKSCQRDGTHQIRKTTPRLSTYGEKTWTTIKEIARRIKLWGQNRSFRGLTSWYEDEKNLKSMYGLNLTDHMRLHTFPEYMTDFQLFTKEYAPWQSVTFCNTNTLTFFIKIYLLFNQKEIQGGGEGEPGRFRIACLTITCLSKQFHSNLLIQEFFTVTCSSKTVSQ